MKRGLRCAATLAVLLLFLVSALATSAEPTATLRGRVSLSVDGAVLSDVGPVVVMLEALDGIEAKSASKGGQVRQRAARFTPGFLVVAAGQTVEMSNDDSIFHNVFSFSRGNGFDLGLYPSGESRSVTLRESGVVKIYCSIHESMNATIVVAPSRHFANVDSQGRFTIASVPPGRYHLRTWCERLPDTEREVVLVPGQTLELEIDLTSDLAG